MCQLIKEHHGWRLILSEKEELTLHEAVRHHPHADARERAAAVRHPWRRAFRHIGSPATACCVLAILIASTSG